MSLSWLQSDGLYLTLSLRRRERAGELEEGEVRDLAEPQPKKKKEELDPLLTRTGHSQTPLPVLLIHVLNHHTIRTAISLSHTGGAYIPPAKLRMMQAQIKDKNSVAYQKLAWEALKKSINGLINKVSLSSPGHLQNTHKVFLLYVCSDP